jgi:streptogramin lyase
MTRSRFAALTFVLASAATSFASSPLGPGGGACDQTYTTDADFDLGVLFNVNHNSPNNDQLQLNATAAPLPFVNIACSARGTIVRIDVNTGAILGEYFTAPNGMGRDPSRTTVDRLGSVWVSNRAEGGFSGGQNKGSVARIGIVLGGTRGTLDAQGNFTPDPNGEYLQPPFQYSTCIDRNGDGYIRTSSGLGNILAWTNAGGADTDGGVSTAEDECIINYTRITGTNARTVAIDANNDVWTGGLGDLDHEKLDGGTGQPVPGTQFNLGCGGYGGLVDGNGILWSARGGTGLLRYDPAAATGVSLGNGCGDYGLGIDPQTGNIWHTNLSGGMVCVIDPSGACQGCHSYGSANAQGCAVDGNGDVWVAHSLFGAVTVGHLRTDGTFVGNVPLTHASGSGNGPTGVAIDTNGKVWVACINSNNALRIDPTAGPAGGGGFPVGAVDMVVDLGPGAGPYNYSDMTGFVSIGSTSPTGSWTVIQDSGVAGQDWGAFSWSSQEPQGTSITVEVRADDDPINLPSLPFVVVANGQSTCGTGVTGQFVEIRVTLDRQPQVNVSPVLFDLTASCCQAGGPATLTCPPEFFEVWNGGPSAGQTDPDHTGWATYSSGCAAGGATLTYTDFDVTPPWTPGAPELRIARLWELTDNCGASLACEQHITLLSPSGQLGALTTDVEPGDCPNLVNVPSPGSIQVALVGTWEHDATTVVPSSLKLARVDGVGSKMALGKLPRLVQDVTQPYYGAPGGCINLAGEGHADVVVTVPIPLLRRAFKLASLPPGTLVEVSLTGNLLDGTTFDARDFLVVK